MNKLCLSIGLIINIAAAAYYFSGESAVEEAGEQPTSLAMEREEAGPQSTAGGIKRAPLFVADARVGARMDAGTASQLIAGVRRTLGG